MIYCITPPYRQYVITYVDSPGRNARSDLSMSNAPRKQLGIQPEEVRNSDKHVVLPMHNLHVDQQVMYQYYTSKCWYPTVFDSLCPEPGSYKIPTRDSITYRKAQSHLKPFIPEYKNLLSEYWIYSIIIVFTGMCKCPCNGVQAAKSCTHSCMKLNIK